MAETALKAVRALRAAFPDTKLSQEFDGFWNAFRGTGYGGQGTGYKQPHGLAITRKEAIEKVRGLANTDEDVGGAKRDFLALVNSGWSLSFEGDDAQQARAKELCDTLTKRVFSYGGNMDGLVNNQCGELYEAGSTSLEWYPYPSKTEIQDAAIVPTEEVEARRINNQLKYFQHKGFFLADKGIELNPFTYKHIALNPQGSSPYGLPIPIAALCVLERKKEIDLGVSRVIKLLSKGALVSVTVPKPSPAELGCDSDDDPRYAKELETFMNEVAELVLAGQDKQIFFAYETEQGKPDIKIHTLSSTATGVREIELANLQRVWAGIGSTSFLRGYMDSTTESLAKTVWLMIKAHAVNAQILIKAQFEFGFNQHLRLAGVPATAKLEFDPPTNPYAGEEATADLTRAQTDDILMRLFGAEIYKPEMAKRWGIVIPDATQTKDPLDVELDTLETAQTEAATIIKKKLGGV